MKRIAKRFADATLIPLITTALNRAGISSETQLRDRQAALRREMTDLRDRLELLTPGNPCIKGFKAFSQTDEDGIFQDIFGRLPSHSKTFIEIGCGRGIENNTHYLALQGYRGCWIDGGDANIDYIRDNLGGLEFKNLLVQKRFVDAENIGQILGEYSGFLGTREPTLFSLDIDGNDLYVMREAVKHINPLVICAEYNPKFPPPVAVSIPYNPKHFWRGGDYHGASLQAFCDLLTDYRLVSCNLCGANAFFVRHDLAGAFGNFTPAQLYQPFRENLIDLRSEHFPTLRWLKDKLAES